MQLALGSFHVIFVFASFLCWHYLLVYPAPLSPSPVLRFTACYDHYPFVFFHTILVLSSTSYLRLENAGPKLRPRYAFLHA